MGTFRANQLSDGTPQAYLKCSEDLLHPVQRSHEGDLHEVGRVKIGSATLGESSPLTREHRISGVIRQA